MLISQFSQRIASYAESERSEFPLTTTNFVKRIISSNEFDAFMTDCPGKLAVAATEVCIVQPNYSRCLFNTILRTTAEINQIGKFSTMKR